MKTRQNTTNKNFIGSDLNDRFFSGFGDSLVGRSSSLQ